MQPGRTQAIIDGLGELSLAMTALWPLALLCLLPNGYPGLVERNGEFLRQSFVIIYVFNLLIWGVVVRDVTQRREGGIIFPYCVKAREQKGRGWVTHCVFFSCMNLLDILWFYTVPGAAGAALAGGVMGYAGWRVLPEIVLRYSPISLLHAKHLMVVDRRQRVMRVLSLPREGEELRFERALVYPVQGRVYMARVAAYGHKFRLSLLEDERGRDVPGETSRRGSDGALAGRAVAK